MPTTSPATDPLAAVARLQQATNAHDLEAIVACFAEDYVNETPVHPSRSFAGREQVRRNWARNPRGRPRSHVDDGCLRRFG